MVEAVSQKTPSDTELLHAVARGDESALAAIYDRYNSILLGLLLRILHSRVEAEDVLQEVFLQIWQRAANFDEARGRAFTWMVTLARSRAIDRLRALQSRQRADDTALRDAPEAVGDAGDDVYHGEQREIVRAALAEIPEEQRRALLLAYFEGLTQSEIAERLGQPLGTVKTRMRSGMSKLRDVLSERMGWGPGLNI
ncbi:MAG TPA: sigma-70 family RNA polymerase sigma factor [Pyrinomonadaceae bacterium]|jgi:RNA polymerase sigma-70 factor (ECF subfamily)|nr:sigma-70 family RNA polymerase sigma factor [Pyrinomonadaceae bacterium]